MRRKVGSSESGSKKVEQQTLDNRIDTFNQAAYSTIAAHSGANLPNTTKSIRQAHTELDKILHLHTSEAESLSSKEGLEFLSRTRGAMDNLRELFSQITINQRQLETKAALSTAANNTGIHSPSSPRINRGPLPPLPTPQKIVKGSEPTSEENQAKAEKTKVARQAFQKFDQILDKANMLASAVVSPNDLSRLNAEFKEFQESTDYQALEKEYKETIEKQFAIKVNKIIENPRKQVSNPTTVTQAAPARSKENESGAKLSMALSFKHDDLLNRANNLHHHGAKKEPEIKKLHADYQEFIAKAEFQALKGSIKNGFISTMEKLMPPLPKEVSAVVMQAQTENKGTPTIGTRRQKSVTSPPAQADTQVPLPKEASAILAQAQKLVSEKATPKEIVQVINEYHQLTQRSDFKNAAQSAKDQFVESFENAIKDLSMPNKKMVASAATKTKPLPVPPVFRERMQEKLNSQSKENVTPTRSSRSGSFKGP